MKIVRQSILFLLVSTAGITLFHLLIIFGAIPYEITWGGRLKSINEMYAFESLSILINLFFALLLLRKGSYLQKPFSSSTVNIGLWVFAVLFGLNTLGNLVAQTNFEKAFALVTLTYCICLVWVLRATRIRS